MCLSAQYHAALARDRAKSTDGSFDRRNQESDGQEKKLIADFYKDQVIKCLKVGHYTKGGPYVLETLILYVLIEWFYLEDMDTGISVLVANIVQIALHMGYHRDAKHFPSISPFAGEMRRRVWAMILQLDFSVSTQLGLPGVVRHSHIETLQPSNLHDHDFDENTTILPDPRPETEVTPVLYVLAKLRLVAVGRKVMDMVTDAQVTDYAETMQIDQEINEAKISIPSSLKWNGFTFSLNAPSITLLAIWLECITLHLKVVLHKTFLDPARRRQEYQSSRTICLTAAMELLALQHSMEEELRPGGLLHESGWRISTSFSSPFLLATSVLCFYLQDTAQQKTSDETSTHDGDHDAGAVDTESVRATLETSLEIWIRRGRRSREARKAAIAVHHILGGSGASPAPLMRTGVCRPEPPFNPALAISYFPGSFGCPLFFMDAPC